TMKRKKPSFNESYHGYRTFSELLEDAQKEGLLELETDRRSRTYVVTRFGAEMHARPSGPAEAPPKKKSRRRRGGAKRKAPAAGPLNPAELDRLRDLIRPAAAEANWARVPWKTSLWEARRKAAEEGKPILLWEMDGHPLGCT